VQKGFGPLRIGVLCLLVGTTFRAHAQAAPTWTYDVPNQAAEQATYDSALTWAWTASDKVPEFAVTYGGPTSASFDVHDLSEGDDLWTHYQQYRRTGNPLYRTWALGWRNYFVSGAYRSGFAASGESTGFLYDHMYGPGLVLWAHYENDAAALAEAETLAGIVESHNSGVTPGSTAMAYWGSRSKARHLILATYVAEKTGSARWTGLRDKLIDAWVRSPDWRTGAAGGNYFISREQASSVGTNGAAAYDAGRRINSAFQFALHAEALWRAYLATGRSDVRDKLVNMALWAEYYAHDPAYVNPMVGAWYGQNGDLSRWHRDGDSGSTNVKGTDPVYDTASVNTLVIGYKLTGRASMLNLARTMFRRGTIFAAGSSGDPPTTKLVADNQVHHYVDTLTNPDGYLFDYNKGELQYTYLLFENGGNPIVMGTLPRPPTNLTAN
jgi:hypothetical protein